MALSLQEQLLQAGLADKSKAKQARADKRKKQKQKNKQKQPVLDENQLAAQEKLEAKKEKDRQLNQQKQAEAEKKAIAAQVRQLITMNAQPKDKGDIVINFTDDNVVKRMYVTEVTRNRVMDGRLAVVKLDEGYELVAAPVAEKIAERAKDVVVYQAQDAASTNTEKSEEDDWYADYEIPDDLTW